MIVLSVNAGSSSLKFTAYKMPEEEVLISGVFERIGIDEGFYTLKLNGEKIKKEKDLPNHEVAVNTLLEELLENKVVKSYDEIEAVGHRVVHGGEKYTESVLITEDVKKTIEVLSDLAPLHNPANLVGINTFEKMLPNVKNVAVFDTAFHQTMPASAYIYPIPYEWYTQYGVRKYGFHGTSHRYIAKKISEIMGRDDLKIISCHLGNGGSLAAIKDGKVIDTSLGFTPNAGLMMGTRSGGIDLNIIPYVIRKSGKSMEEVIEDLNKRSGFLGVSGKSSDSRDISEGIENGDSRCILAEEIYEGKIIRYLSNYFVELGGADVICFAGGIGENAVNVRENLMRKIECLGVKLDEEANKKRGEVIKISTDDSKVACYVIPTDEEVMIARDTFAIVQG